MRTALQCFPLQELRDEKRGARFLADIEQRADVRMGESRDGARFAVKAFAELRSAASASGSTLIATVRSRRLSAFVHLAHAPAPSGAMISYGPSREPAIKAMPKRQL